MKKDDKIMVTWPNGGKTGPYEAIHLENYGPVVWIDGQICILPRAWCEPAEPEIEIGRLVVGNNGAQVIYGHYRRPACNDPMRHKILNRGMEIMCSNVKPIHRRWNELKDIDQSDFGTIIVGSTNKTIDFYDTKHIYKKAYKLITGEEHP